MPTKMVSLRIDKGLLEYLTERATSEHRALSNLIVSILLDAKENRYTSHIKAASMIDTWKTDFKGYIDSLNLQRDDYNGIMEYIDEVPFVQP